MERLRQEELESGRIVVHASGEIDAADVDTMRALLKRSFAKSAEVIVDLSEIVYLDSSILAVLITESLDADRENRRLTLVTGENGILRNFELKGLMQVMHIVTTRCEA